MKFKITDTKTGEKFSVDEVLPKKKTKDSTEIEEKEIVKDAEDFSKDDIKVLKELVKIVPDLKTLLESMKEDKKDKEDKEDKSDESEDKAEKVEETEETEEIDESEESEDEEDFDNIDTLDDEIGTDEETEESEDEELVVHDSKKSFGSVEKKSKAVNDSTDIEDEIATAWAKRYNGGK